MHAMLCWNAWQLVTWFPSGFRCLKYFERENDVTANPHLGATWEMCTSHKIAFFWYSSFCWSHRHKRQRVGKLVTRAFHFCPQRNIWVRRTREERGASDVTAGSQQGRRNWFSWFVTIRFYSQYRHERKRAGKLITRAFRFCPQRNIWVRRTREERGGSDVTAGSQQGRRNWFSWIVTIRFYSQYRHER